MPYLDRAALDRVHSVEELEGLCRERLPPRIWEWLCSGAGSNTTTHANRMAFWRWVVVPHILRDISTVDTSTSVLGRRVALPVLFAPTGVQRLFHPEGERAVACAAARLGTTVCLSTSSSVPLEEIATLVPAPWFQLYWLTDRGLTRELVERASAAGFGAIALTVDAATQMWRESEARDPVDLPDGIEQANFPGRSVAVASDLTWDSIETLRSWTSLPIVLKGIVTPEDARLAVERGVEGVVVSNHGGRALDWTIPSLDALPEVVEAVEGRLEVYLDGGLRRGSDVFKALALGARAVLVGRPQLWGLASGGEEGVVRLVELMGGELTSIMGAAGAPSVAAIDRDMVGRAA